MGCGTNAENTRETTWCKDIPPFDGIPPAVVGIMILKGIGRTAIDLYLPLTLHHHRQWRQQVQGGVRFQEQLPDIMVGET